MAPDAPNDEPGDVPFPPSPITPDLDYNRERRNEILRGGGRGCFLGVIMAAALLIWAVFAARP